MPSAYRLPFCMSWAPVCPEKGRADRQTDRLGTWWGQTSPIPTAIRGAQGLSPTSKSSKISIFHRNFTAVIDILTVLKHCNDSWSCFYCEKGRISPPGIQLLRDLVQGGDIPPCCAAARHLSNFCQETSFSWWINQETAWKAQHKKAEREIGLWCSCLKSLSDQFQSKTYVQTKGSIYFKIHLTAWKAFLYLFGILRAWLLPMKYIPVSEALLFIQTQQFSSPTVFNLWILVLFSYKE